MALPRANFFSLPLELKERICDNWNTQTLEYAQNVGNLVIASLTLKDGNIRDELLAIQFRKLRVHIDDNSAFTQDMVKAFRKHVYQTKYLSVQNIGEGVWSDIWIFLMRYLDHHNLMTLSILTVSDWTLRTFKEEIIHRQKNLQVYQIPIYFPPPQKSRGHRGLAEIPPDNSRTWLQLYNRRKGLLRRGMSHKEGPIRSLGDQNGVVLYVDLVIRVCPRHKRKGNSSTSMRYMDVIVPARAPLQLVHQALWGKTIVSFTMTKSPEQYGVPVNFGGQFRHLNIVTPFDTPELRLSRLHLDRLFNVRSTLSLENITVLMLHRCFGADVVLHQLATLARTSAVNFQLKKLGFWHEGNDTYEELRNIGMRDVDADVISTLLDALDDHESLATLFDDEDNNLLEVKDFLWDFLKTITGLEHIHIEFESQRRWHELTPHRDDLWNRMRDVDWNLSHWIESHRRTLQSVSLACGLRRPSSEDLNVLRHCPHLVALSLPSFIMAAQMYRECIESDFMSQAREIMDPLKAAGLTNLDYLHIFSPPVSGVETPFYSHIPGVSDRLEVVTRTLAYLLSISGINVQYLSVSLRDQDHRLDRTEDNIFGKFACHLKVTTDPMRAVTLDMNMMDRLWEQSLFGDTAWIDACVVSSRKTGQINWVYN